MRDVKERFADLVPGRDLVKFEKGERERNAHDELIFIAKLKFHREIIQRLLPLLSRPSVLYFGDRESCRKLTFASRSFSSRFRTREFNLEKVLIRC